MEYLYQVRQMIAEAQATEKVLMVGSVEEVKLLKMFCKQVNVKVFTSRRVLPGSPQLWSGATKP